MDVLGLGQGSLLANSLKHRVVSLASNSGVISTVQMAAQATLQSGWSILLPTAEERARALSTLLSGGGEPSSYPWSATLSLIMPVYALCSVLSPLYH